MVAPLLPYGPEPTAPDATRDPLTDPREGDWFVDVEDSCAVREIIGREKNFVTFCINGGSPNDMSVATFLVNRRCRGARPMTPAEVQAFQRDGTRPSAPTPIVHVPTESAGADGARLAPSEHRMCSDLAADGMSPFYAADGSRRWMRRNFATPSDIEAAPTTAVAHAAMRAAKGARLPLPLSVDGASPEHIARLDAIIQQITGEPSPSLAGSVADPADGARLVTSEAEMAAELRAAPGWKKEAHTWWNGPNGYEDTADAHAAMRAAKGAR